VSAKTTAARAGTNPTICTKPGAFVVELSRMRCQMTTKQHRVTVKMKSHTHPRRIPQTRRLPRLVRDEAASLRLRKPRSKPLPTQKSQMRPYPSSYEGMEWYRISSGVGNFE
jgi:hypothetical protein